MAKRDPMSTISRRTDEDMGRERAVGLLRAVHPSGLDWETRLGDDAVVLGRDAGDAPALEHGTVSRAHARIRRAGGSGHVIADLRSHNGTRVDGERLEGDGERPLAPGSVVQLGDVLLAYERVPRGAAADPPEVAGNAVPGRAACMRMVRAAVARAARDPAPILLMGETGTGKERIARELHRLSGRGGPLVAVNCAALSSQLVESQLFGHRKGAFTGATHDHIGFFRAAEGGTLFLDEIGELPLEIQPKLLRAVQEREVQPVGFTQAVPVDVRLISATNRDVEAEIEAGRFRRDLYGRIALWEIRVPPLRERRVDLLDWVERLNQEWLAGRAEGRSGSTAEALRFTPDAAAGLLLHDWPDNLRGVDRLVHALATRGEHGEIARAHLPSWIGRADQTAPGAPAAAAPAPARPSPTRDEFALAVEQHGGNVRALARHFGRDRRQIYRWLEIFEIPRNRGNG